MGTKQMSKRVSSKDPAIIGVVRHFLVYLAVVICLFPLFWVFLTSIKPIGAMVTIPPTVIFKPTFEHYVIIWEQNFARFLQNSIIIAIASSFLTLLMSVPAAYGLSRIRFRGREQLTFLIFATRFLPYVCVVLPLFLLMLRFHLVGTRLGVVLAQQMRLMPFMIWLLRSFFVEIPGNLEEAAMVDGTTRWGAFIKIALPLAAPAVGAALILTFIWSWNEYLIALILSGRDAKTLTVGLSRYLGDC